MKETFLLLGAERSDTIY